MIIVITVDVTAEDIALGVAEDCEKCPIARAIHRALLGSPIYMIGIDAMYAGFRDANGGNVQVRVPKMAAVFIKDFDNGQAVYPFSFEFRVGDSPEVQHGS